MLEISHDIPVPPKRHTSQFKVALNNMKPGDSFAIPEVSRHYLAQCISQMKRRDPERTDWVFTIRKQGDGTCRCWRVK